MAEATGSTTQSQGQLEGRVEGPKIDRPKVERPKVERPKIERPLSPHLQIYRIQITSVSSILTRITGHALMAGVVLGVWWLFAAAVSDSYFAVANAVVTSWFGKLVFAGSLWAVWYHYLAGLRHLYFDAGHGLDIETAERLGWACIAGSVLLTLLTIVIV